ncbi:MAG: hypothetical protein J6S67_05020 [Methanobrevibacter sp.]|nr:hypothetical protein [Methanobrevibacter sp.]
MTFKQAKRDFINVSDSFNDYWEMQFAWSCYIDGLNRDGQITDKQLNNWGNPCTVRSFKRFNKGFKGE